MFRGQLSLAHTAKIVNGRRFLSSRAQSVLSALDIPTNGEPIPGVYDGEWKGTGELMESKCPATGESLAKVITATIPETREIIKRSKAAYKSLRDIPAPTRGSVLRQLRQAIADQREQLGALVSLEMGKIKTEGVGEVQEVIDICDYGLGLSRMLNGRVVQSERPGHTILEVPNPLGLVSVISAFNFPMAVYGWNLAISFACGNATLWKPSETTSLCAIALTRIISRVLKDNGIDPAVAALACGSGPIGTEMAASKEVNMVSFTGSEAVGKGVGQTVTVRGGKLLLELGGNNAAVVMPDADMDMALRGIAFGAVGTAGQRCTTTRRLFLHRSIAPEFLERLKKVYTSPALQPGDPLNPKTLLGPLHNEKAAKAFKNGVKELRNYDNEIILGGELYSKSELPEELKAGHFAKPTIVLPHVSYDLFHKLWANEYFSPILKVAFFSDLEEAIEMNNAVPQGLSSSLWTRDMRNVGKWIGPSGSDCGIVNVNAGTSGAEIGAAFGGNKTTGWGRESGGDAWKQYVRWSACTLNFTDQMPLAQGVEFN